MRNHWLLIVALAISNAHAATKPATCTLRRLAAVELRITERGMMVIPVEIDGVAGTMSLDLANFNGRLTQTAVGQLKLAVTDSTTTVRTIDGKRQPVRYASFDSLTIGGIPIARGRLQTQSYATDPPDIGFGNITTDILRNVDFEIDPEHKSLRLYAQETCPDGVVYWTKHYSSARLYRNESGALILPMALDGKPIEARLITTTRDSVLRTDISRFLFGFDEHSPGNDVMPDAYGNESTFFRAMKLTAQGLDAANVKIRLAPTASNQCEPRINTAPTSAASYDKCGGAAPLLIGTGILEKLRMYFALKEGVLYFSAADAGDDSLQSPKVATQEESAH